MPQEYDDETLYGFYLDYKEALEEEEYCLLVEEEEDDDEIYYQD